MTLLAIHGFDHEGSLDDFWKKSNSAISYALDSVVFRNGRASLRLSGSSVYNLYKFIPLRSTYIIGAAVRISVLPNVSTGVLFDFNGSYLGISSAQKIVFVRSGAIVATSVDSLLPDTWYYLEMKIFLDNAVGTVEIRQDGVPVVTYNGDTLTNAFSFMGSFGLGSVRGPVSFTYIDDLYVCDDQGAVNNDFLGDCIVTTLIPTGPGDLTQFTPSAGANWENVDESPPNGDTDYNDGSGAILPKTDIFATQDITPPVGQIASIFGVKTSVYAKNSQYGNLGLKPTFKISGSLYHGSSEGLGQSYYYHEKIFENSPATGVAWAHNEINSLQLGYTRDL